VECLSKILRLIAAWWDRLHITVNHRQTDVKMKGREGGREGGETQWADILGKLYK
jgi:hypothetical protein